MLNQDAGSRIWGRNSGTVTPSVKVVDAGVQYGFEG